MITQSWTRQIFRGNPYTSIQSIDVSKGIAHPGRLSSVIDFILQVSACNITAIGTDKPYRDLEFFWDFGDGNTNYGPEAVNVYYTPGTYTVILRVRGKCNDKYIVATTSIQVVVSKFIPKTTWYYDGINGEDNNDGLSPQKAKKSAEHLAKQCSAANNDDNVEFLLACGTVLETKVNNIQFDRGNTRRFGSYGTGNRPIIRYTGPIANNFIRLCCNNDKVISNIDFDGNGLITDSIVNAASGLVSSGRYNYFNNCRAYGLQAKDHGILWCINSSPVVNNLSAFGLFNCAAEQPNGITNHSIYLEGSDWLFVKGCSFAGSGGVPSTGTENIRDHHLYFNIQGNNGLIQGNKFTKSAHRSYCINTNCTDKVGQLSQYIYIAENDIQGTSHGIDLSNSNNNPLKNGQFDNVVIEGNEFQSLYGDGVILYYNCLGVTIRDNSIHSNTGYSAINVSDKTSNYDIYLNKISHPNGYGILDYSSANNRTIKGNFIYCNGPKFLQINNPNPLISEGNIFLSSTPQDSWFNSWQAKEYDLTSNINYTDMINGNWNQSTTTSV